MRLRISTRRPARLSESDVEQRVERRAESGPANQTTSRSQAQANPSSVRIATPGVTTAEQTVDNLLAAVPAAVELVGGWDNVLSVGIKTSTSVLLPVWNAKLGGRFKDAADEMEVEEDAPKPVAKAVKAAKAAPPEGTPKKEAAKLKKSSTIGSGATKKAKVAAVGSGKSKGK